MLTAQVTFWPKGAGLALEIKVLVELTGLTVCVSTAEVLPALLTSPAYEAVMLCAPTLSELALKLATPPTSVAVPSVDAPSLNLTVPPASTPLPMVAVHVTVWPKVDGFTLE